MRNDLSLDDFRTLPLTQQFQLLEQLSLADCTINEKSVAKELGEILLNLVDMNRVNIEIKNFWPRGKKPQTLDNSQLSRQQVVDGLLFFPYTVETVTEKEIERSRVFFTISLEKENPEQVKTTYLSILRLHQLLSGDDFLAILRPCMKKRLAFKSEYEFDNTDTMSVCNHVAHFVSDSDPFKIRINAWQDMYWMKKYRNKYIENCIRNCLDIGVPFDFILSQISKNLRWDFKKVAPDVSEVVIRLKRDKPATAARLARLLQKETCLFQNSEIRQTCYRAIDKALKGTSPDEMMGCIQAILTVDTDQRHLLHIFKNTELHASSHVNYMCSMEAKERKKLSSKYLEQLDEQTVHNRAQLQAMMLVVSILRRDEPELAEKLTTYFHPILEQVAS